MSGRPLDVLEAAVGDDVEVRLKSGELYRGTLAGYDQHMNLVLDDVVESPVESTASDGDGGAGADPSERSNPDSDGGGTDSGDGSSDSDAEAPERGRDTTIIRGDNVVSINP